MEIKPNRKKSVDMIPDKKTKNKIKDIDKEPKYDSYPDISSTASVTECTGMMYAPPQSEEELESYQELFDMEIPTQKDEKE